MRKIIAAINMTLDGHCDHTAIEPDEEIHQFYQDLLDEGDVILYGRITYHLMQYWQDLVKNPSGDQSMDDFAMAMDRIPKIIFSTSLHETGWESATLATKSLEEEVLELKKKAGRDILVGSRSLIIQLLNLNLIDEFRLCIHPVVAGSGLPLFEEMKDRTLFKLIKTKSFGGGAVTLYYESRKE